jgi:tetratricopeptide (TPR) repeat protein
MSEPKISLCLIAKNEARRLPRCLDSVKGAVDEIVVVDTGSTDATKAVAQSYGAKVFDFAWQDDFAAAKNEALRLASGDWLLVLDADEIIPAAEAAKLRGLVRAADVEAYKLHFLAIAEAELERAPLEQIVPLYAYFDIRLFRNGLGIRYEGAIHESLWRSISQAKGRTKLGDVKVYHYGFAPKEGREKRAARNLTIALKEAKNKPDSADASYDLARAYAEMDQLPDAINCAQKTLRQIVLATALQPGREKRNLYEVQLTLADLYERANDHEEAALQATLALEMQKGPADVRPWLILGKAFTGLKNYPVAAGIYQIVQSEDFSGPLKSGGVYNYPLDYLQEAARALAALGKVRPAPPA